MLSKIRLLIFSVIIKTHSSVQNYMKSIKVEHHLLAMFPVLLAPAECFEVDFAPPNDGKSSVMSGTLSTVW